MIIHIWDNKLSVLITVELSRWQKNWSSWSLEFKIWKRWPEVRYPREAYDVASVNQLCSGLHLPWTTCVYVCVITPVILLHHCRIALIIIPSFVWISTLPNHSRYRVIYIVRSIIPWQRIIMSYVVLIHYMNIPEFARLWISVIIWIWFDFGSCSD